MKITHKLMLTIAVLVIGFVAIGLVYRQVLQIDAQALDRISETSKFAQLAQQTQINLQSAQVPYNNFQLNKDLAALEEFENAMSAARENITKLQQLSTSKDEGTELPDESKLLTRLAEATETFHSDVYAAAELQISWGLDEDSGLLGEMRFAAQDIETLLVSFAEPKLLNSLLQIRRYEKNLLSRKDTKQLDQIAEEQKQFTALLANTRVSSQTMENINELMSDYNTALSQVQETLLQQEQASTQIEITVSSIPALVDAVLETAEQKRQAVVKLSEEQTTNATRLFGGVLIAVGVIVALALLLLSAGITGTLGVLQNTVRKVTEGDSQVRSNLTGSDELHALGKAFDNLLDERVATLAQAQQENEQLNDSIISLLHAVAQLSQRDLTVRVPVAEDITGPVADSLNLLTAETAKVLQGVSRISDKVATSSNIVKAQSDTVMALAGTERQQVAQTSSELADAAEAMNEIAELAQTSNQAADEAIKKTQLALETVTDTVSGINATRDTIRETEKRIKRLGERSQEISGAVNLINNIAERTHILALNASMHAASAGEAGRGFAVVADEVQRLAENARQATEQIANLVSNIQTETQDTVATMNAAITQVVDGSRLAEQAGDRMKETQASTAALVSSVQRIAEGSTTQAMVSNELRNRARQIEKSTEETSQQLQEQGVQTSKLLEYAQNLVDSVRIFTLPGAQQEAEVTAQQSTLKVVQG